MTADTILRSFSIIVFGVILVIAAVGGLIARMRAQPQNGGWARYDPWALGKITFIGCFIMVLPWGATKGFLFISPTDGWIEIITEALAVSLMATAAEVIGAGAYTRWRKDRT
jgi:hypothetical protein